MNTAVFKGVARVARSFRLEIGSFRAQGLPAALVAAAGLVVAVGVARALAKSADQLPETIREARQFAEALRRRDAPRLHA